LGRRRSSITSSLDPEKLGAILQPLQQRKLFIGCSLQLAYAIDNDKVLSCRTNDRPLNLFFAFLKDGGGERMQDIGCLEAMLCRRAKADGIRPFTTMAGVSRPWQPHPHHF
jgi:hypothetical protein